MKIVEIQPKIIIFTFFRKKVRKIFAYIKNLLYFCSRFSMVKNSKIAESLVNKQQNTTSL